MEKAVNVSRLEWCCATTENRIKAWKKYLVSKKVVKIAYSTFCRKIKKFGIDVSNFVRKAKKWTEFDYVLHNHSIGKRPNSTTREKVLNYLGRFCCTCGDTETLELHHIDWNRNNTKMKNLAVLCSKCHSLVHKNPR